MAKEANRWLESSDVVPMFPTLVWNLRLEATLRESIGARILAALEEMRRGQPPIETGHGWQSEQMLHERTDLREFVECVDRSIASVLRFLQIGPRGFKITA